MKIRCHGTPVNIDRRTCCKALRFYANYLLSPSLSETLTITLKFGRTRGFKAEVGWVDRAERPKKFQMLIRETMSYEEVLSALAHEMVHVKQYATGQLRDYVTDPNFCRWENEAVPFSDEEDELYWFAPWEIEARGYERGLWKLFVKKN